jgi:hypothetical protein
MRPTVVAPVATRLLLSQAPRRVLGSFYDYGFGVLGRTSMTGYQAID